MTAFGHFVSVDADSVSRTAAVVMMAFGVVLLVPRAQTVLATLAAPLANRASSQLDARERAGVAGQFGVGMLLGAVWSPCVGPTLGGAIGLAASGEHLGQAAVTMLAFGVGVSTVLLALAYGSRQAVSARREQLAAWMPWAKPLMGAILVAVGIAVLFHIDRMIEGWLLDLMPVWLQDLSVSV